MSGVEVTKVATEMMSKIASSTAQPGQPGLANAGQVGDKSNFDTVLEQYGVGGNDLTKDEVRMMIGPKEFGHPADRVISAQNLDIDISRVTELNAPQSGNKVANMLAEVNRVQLGMDDIVNLISSGNSFSNREMLLMQAAMHKMVFESELAVRITDAFKSFFQNIQRTQV